jgi:hypothetical protein
MTSNIVNQVQTDHFGRNCQKWYSEYGDGRNSFASAAKLSRPYITIPHLKMGLTLVRKN